MLSDGNWLGQRTEQLRTQNNLFNFQLTTENVLFLENERMTQQQSGKQPIRFGDIYQSASRTPTSTADELWCQREGWQIQIQIRKGLITAALSIWVGSWKSNQRN